MLFTVKGISDECKFNATFSPLSSGTFFNALEGFGAFHVETLSGEILWNVERK